MKKNNLINNSIDLLNPSLENLNLTTNNNLKSFYRQLKKLITENYFLKMFMRN
jgi:hypothetical protein